MRRMVDFPQPEGPSNATTSLGRIGERDVLAGPAAACPFLRELLVDVAQLAEERRSVRRVR